MNINIDNLRLLESYFLHERDAPKYLLRILDDIKHEVLRLEMENKQLAAEVKNKNEIIKNLYSNNVTVTTTDGIKLTYIG